MSMLTGPMDDASRHHILVVDDEEIVLVALRETLLRQGYRVVAATSATEALTLLRQQTFAVILADHQMPEMTGVELLTRASKLQPDATRILITAALNLATVMDSINQGEVYRFVLKPWLREELLVAVANGVQHHELITVNNALQAALRSIKEKLEQLDGKPRQQAGPAARDN